MPVHSSLDNQVRQLGCVFHRKVPDSILPRFVSHVCQHIRVRGQSPDAVGNPGSRIVAATKKAIAQKAVGIDAQRQYGNRAHPGLDERVGEALRYAGIDKQMGAFEYFVYLFLWHGAQKRYIFIPLQLLLEGLPQRRGGVWKPDHQEFDIRQLVQARGDFKKQFRPLHRFELGDPYHGENDQQAYRLPAARGENSVSTDRLRVRSFPEAFRPDPQIGR